LIWTPRTGCGIIGARVERDEMTTNSKVYVIQDTNHNLSHATQYGEFVFINKNDYPVWGDSSDDFLNNMSKVLSAYDPIDDYLLMIGDPVSIGLAFSYITEKWNMVRLLKWDGQSKKYLPIIINVFGLDDARRTL